jgi:hypothetical protein
LARTKRLASVGHMAFPLLLAAAAASLTVRTGETWLFRLAQGQPVAAHRSAADAAPKRGEVRVTARRMLGTTLTMLNNSATAYTFRATLVGADGKAIVGKSCVLPAENRLTMESWPQVAASVTIGEFKPTKSANC